MIGKKKNTDFIEQQMLSLNLFSDLVRTRYFVASPSVNSVNDVTNKLLYLDVLETGRQRNVKKTGKKVPIPPSIGVAWI